MPNRDYYFNTDSNSVRVRGEYHKHVANMFHLLGQDAAAAQRSSDVVYGIEEKLAASSRKLEQLRDPWANYNPMTLAELNKLAPNVDWATQFATMGVHRTDTLIVGQPEFFKTADSCMAAVSLADLKTYMRWNLVGDMANALASPIEKEHFHFYSTVLSGTKVMRPRWKRVLDAEDSNLGELMGMAWVREYCSPATKARYERLTNDIISVYRDRIAALPWMSEATRQAALAKLDKVGRKVGYPDKWRDYSAMDFDRSSYASVHMKVNSWWFHYEADKLGKPIDRTTWDMNPQTYNAYYDGSKVEIVLPAAAFMIPGVPDSLVDDALLYSYAGGSTIGHEITHGFDDEGRQFDAHGNLNPWWTTQDSVQFAQRAKRLVDEFDEFKVGDLHVRGQATLGENIADLGGVRLGYEAFKKTAQYKSGARINGFTPDQRYFLGYALSWLGVRRPQALAQQVMTDVHAPGYLRVNGPLANIPEFYAAFDIKPGDPMYRSEDKRCVIW
jgi:putative endopeptidase